MADSIFRWKMEVYGVWPSSRCTPNISDELIFRFESRNQGQSRFRGRISSNSKIRLPEENEAVSEFLCSVIGGFTFFIVSLTKEKRDRSAE